MSNIKATDYDLTAKDAGELLGVTLLPHEIRIIAIKKYAKQHGAAALANLFSQFIGLANSVAENNHAALDEMLTQDVLPKPGDTLNLPTIFGALNGVKLASTVDQQSTCGTCAARLGSIPNQCLSTSCMLEECLLEGDDFLCHEKLTDGKATKKCAGFTQLLKMRDKRKEVMA